MSSSSQQAVYLVSTNKPRPLNDWLLLELGLNLRLGSASKQLQLPSPFVSVFKSRSLFS